LVGYIKEAVVTSMVLYHSTVEKANKKATIMERQDGYVDLTSFSL